MNKVLIGGHRGSGCTDNRECRKINSADFPENTLKAFEKAFDDGADFIEIDVVKTADNNLVLIHSNKLSNHVFNQNVKKFVGDYTLEELRNYRVGFFSNGIIPTLEEALKLTEKYRKNNGKLFVNIEIKDVKGTSLEKQSNPSLPELLTKYVKDREDWIVFSSFDINDLIECRKLMPNIKRAMLFDSYKIFERKIYSKGDSRYLNFSEKNIKKAKELADISFCHPELKTVNRKNIKLCGEIGLDVNSWRFHEDFPEKEVRYVNNFIRLAKVYKIEIGIITDFIKEMKKQLEAL